MLPPLSRSWGDHSSSDRRVSLIGALVVPLSAGGRPEELGGGRGHLVPRGVEHDLAERVPPHLEHLGPPDRFPPRALLLLQSGGVPPVFVDGPADDVHPILAPRVLVTGVQDELLLAAHQLEYIR